MKFNNTFEYILPPTGDREGNNITYYLLSDPPANDFVTLSSDRFFISPRLWSQLRAYKMQIILSDLNSNSTPFDFSVTITNSAPRFVKTKPTK